MLIVFFAVSFMLSVTNKHDMLSVIILNAVAVSVAASPSLLAPRV